MYGPFCRKVVNSYSIKKYFVFVCCILLIPSASICVAQQPATDQITIGSFNIQIFGKTKIEQKHTLEVLAKTATNFDIMAIQEVGSNGSTASADTCDLVMKTYTHEINTVMNGVVYQSVHSNQYGIVYRSDKVKLLEFGSYSGSGKITYVPLKALFDPKGKL